MAANRLKAGDSLEQAQLRKLDALIDMAKLKPTDKVLEIGCGWGSLAIRAAQVQESLICCHNYKLYKPYKPYKAIQSLQTPIRFKVNF